MRFRAIITRPPVKLYKLRSRTLFSDGTIQGSVFCQNCGYAQADVSIATYEKLPDGSQTASVTYPTYSIPGASTPSVSAPSQIVSSPVQMPSGSPAITNVGSYTLPPPTGWKPVPSTQKGDRGQQVCSRADGTLYNCPRGRTGMKPLLPSLAIGDFYQPVYASGLQGVFEARKAEIDGSPAMSWINAIGNLNFQSSTTCPKFPIHFGNFMKLNIGTLQVEPPCAIWPILKSIVMLNSVFIGAAIFFRG